MPVQNQQQCHLNKVYVDPVLESITFEHIFFHSAITMLFVCEL